MLFLFVIKFKKDYNKTMINKKVSKFLIISIIFSIMFLLGIVLIIFNSNFFGINHKITLTIGIIFCVLGFYGSPILWINFSENKRKKNLCDQIKLDNIQEIEKLANLNNKNFQETLNDVKDLISKRYLQGYEIYQDKFIIPKQNKVLSEDEILKKNGDIHVKACSSCGAKVDAVGNQSSKCPYCGATII